MLKRGQVIGGELPVEGPGGEVESGHLGDRTDQGVLIAVV
jgi:hypothetical protein